MISIYGLVCPFTGEIRYIGKTARKLKARLAGHFSEARRFRHSHKHRWIVKCLDAGLKPIPWLLEEVEVGHSWQDRERAWIKRGREIGLDLTNQTEGGEGLDWTDPEAKKKYWDNHAAAMKRAREENPQLIHALLEGNKRDWRENREARIAAIVKAQSNPEYKKKLADSMKEVRSRPGYSEKVSKQGKKIWQDHRPTLMAAFAKPEVKAKHSARAKRCWSDAETRDRLMNRWTPESREKQRQAVLSPERQQKIAKAMTPEVRAKQGSKMKEHWARLTPEERAAIRDKSQANKTPEGKARHSARMKKYWADKRAEKAASLAKTGSSNK